MARPRSGGSLENTKAIVWGCSRQDRSGNIWVQRSRGPKCEPAGVPPIRASTHLLSGCCRAPLRAVPFRLRPRLGGRGSRYAWPTNSFITWLTQTLVDRAEVCDLGHHALHFNFAERLEDTGRAFVPDRDETGGQPCAHRSSRSWRCSPAYPRIDGLAGRHLAFTRACFEPGPEHLRRSVRAPVDHLADLGHFGRDGSLRRRSLPPLVHGTTTGRESPRRRRSLCSFELEGLVARRQRHGHAAWSC